MKPAMRIFNPYTAVCLGWQLMVMAFIIIRVLPYAFPYVSNTRLAKQFAQRVWDRSDSNLLSHQYLLDDNSVIHVVVAADTHSLGGLVAVINSVYSHTNKTTLFHLITDQESVQHLRAWMRQPRLTLIYHDVTVFNTSLISQYLKKTDNKDREPTYPLSYAYYYLPLLYPHLDGRLIYLDHDIIVQHDIAELNSTFMNPGDVIAVSDDCQSFSTRTKSLEKTYAGYLNFNNVNVHQTGMKASTCSFNTGVLLINMKEWRAMNVTQKLEKWLILNSEENIFGGQKSAGGSQVPMMIVFYNNYSNIDPLWHVRNLGITSGTSYSKEFISQAKLIHWNGNFKPWGRVSQHSEVWDRYYVVDPTLMFKPVRKY